MPECKALPSLKSHYEYETRQTRLVKFNSHSELVQRTRGLHKNPLTLASWATNYFIMTRMMIATAPDTRRVIYSKSIHSFQLSLTSRFGTHIANYTAASFRKTYPRTRTFAGTMRTLQLYENSALVQPFRGISRRGSAASTPTATWELPRRTVLPSGKLRSNFTSSRLFSTLCYGLSCFSLHRSLFWGFIFHTFNFPSTTLSRFRFSTVGVVDVSFAFFSQPRRNVSVAQWSII